MSIPFVLTNIQELLATHKVTERPELCRGAKVFDLEENLFGFNQGQLYDTIIMKPMQRVLPAGETNISFLYSARTEGGDTYHSSWHELPTDDEGSFKTSLFRALTGEALCR